ncbi:ADP-ribose pyrophosphatase [Hamadaea flava]|uniref:NUDIX hydrolase n=1 Tax=Hamadaea flava TaxID=1742688 RepID=A0ABV8LHU3_9ACTN|nr:NUDIX hydrolase [Hamadaea flava]MCP2324336.1 ADP-ribose pyrophosphatase [Hamadaea flava]
MSDEIGAVRPAYQMTPDVVAIVAVHGTELVLIREFRPAVGERVLQVPMGKIPAGIDPREQALAELAEETGFEARNCEFVACLFSAPGWMNQRMHVFLATDLIELAERPPGDPDEVDIEVVPLPIASLAEAMAGGVLRDARSIAALTVALGAYGVTTTPWKVTTRWPSEA